MRIKELLKEKRLTQQELAAMIGVSYQSMKQTLNAPSVTTATLEKIASALNVPMWELFVSPNDIISTNEDLTALIQHKGDFYKATTIAELENIVAKIKEKCK
jgi:transcriptional regulator with XRE-family HTH domain